MSLHSPTQKSATPTTLVVALAGNPNSGKTTIFNALTGLRQKVANYPGVTVEKKTGRCKLDDGSWATIIDLPGTYSLISRSPDELIASEVLHGTLEGTPAPDVVIVVVDASNLQRNLYLVSQLIELGLPLVVALNMTDVAERRGLRVSAENLQQHLGVPVIPIVGHRRMGISNLKSAISNASIAPMPDWPLPDVMKDQIREIEQALHESNPIRAKVLAERLLIGDRHGAHAKLFDDDRLKPLLDQAGSRLTSLGIDPMQADIEAHYRWIDDVAHRATSVDARPPTGTLDYARPSKFWSDRVDAILIHRFWGLLIFAAIMTGLFVTIFFVADPMMGFMEDSVAWLGSFVAPIFPEGALRDMWNDGIVAGVGGVVVFVPQIALLFVFLAIMEDSGYLARAAFLMDKFLSKVGLHGKSFIPLLSSFACAIPGIMAARTIENRKDRLATIFVAPFMSCSARLPVYFLIIGTLFASWSALSRGTLMFSLYALGVIAAAVTAFVFKRTLLKGPKPAFILEMPSYKIPQLSQVVRTVWVNTKAFLVKAGTIIFCLSIILWAMAYYPRLSPERTAQIEEQWKQRLAASEPLVGFKRNYGGDVIPPGNVEATEALFVERKVASEQLRQSVAGRLGHLLEPAIKPLGYDWKMGIGLVASFAAREVFVSTMGIVYSVGDAEEDMTDLSVTMMADEYADGSKVWTPLVGLSLLVWFVLAMQCMSTIAIVKRETGTWRWPIFMLVYMNALAYVVSLAVYQIGRIWWA